MNTPTQCQNEPAKAFMIAPEPINLYNQLARCDFRCVGTAITYAGFKEDQSLKLPCFFIYTAIIIYMVPFIKRFIDFYFVFA